MYNDSYFLPADKSDAKRFLYISIDNERKETFMVLMLSILVQIVNGRMRRGLPKIKTPRYGGNVYKQQYPKMQRIQTGLKTKASEFKLNIKHGFNLPFFVGFPLIAGTKLLNRAKRQQHNICTGNIFLIFN